MNIYQRIKDLADAKHESIAEVERNLGFSNGLMYKWTKTSPSIDKVKQVADHFNVTTDYLLGRDTAGKSNPEEFFRLDTTGLDDSQAKALRKQMDDYMAFVRQQLKKDD